MNDNNILDFSCDCHIFWDSSSISVDDVIQSLCEEYVKYKGSFSLNDSDAIFIDNSDTRVRINSASVDELKQLPGINLVHAKKIIQSRDQNIYINSYDDLINLGIDSVSVDNLKDLIIIDKVRNKHNVYSGRILDL